MTLSNRITILFIWSKSEIDAKRGQAIHTLTPTPRRRSDPEFLKWDSEINALLDDDYEGEYRKGEAVRMKSTCQLHLNWIFMKILLKNNSFQDLNSVRMNTPVHTLDFHEFHELDDTIRNWVKDHRKPSNAVDLEAVRACGLAHGSVSDRLAHQKNTFKTLYGAKPQSQHNQRMLCTNDLTRRFFFSWIYKNWILNL